MACLAEIELKAQSQNKQDERPTMEQAKLKSELDNLQRLVDRIPRIYWRS